MPVKGRWGLPWLVPRQVDVHVCWGEAVSVGPPNATPSDAEVEAVFRQYVAELQRVFELNKRRCLPPDVASRGLSIRMYGRGPECSSFEPNAGQQKKGDELGEVTSSAGSDSPNTSDDPDREQPHALASRRTR